MRAFRHGQECIGRPGSKNMSKRASGFPGNLGDPVVSTEEIPAGATGQPTPGPTAGARSRRRERSDSRSRGIVRAKETKRGEMGGRKSECLDSTDETGELGPREPGGGKRGIESWNRCWDMRRIPGDSMSVLTKQQRIAEMAKRSPQMVQMVPFRGHNTSIGPLVHWSIGPLVHWSIGPLVHWSIGPLVHWSIGPLVHSGDTILVLAKWIIVRKEPFRRHNTSIGKMDNRQEGKRGGESLICF